MLIADNNNLSQLKTCLKAAHNFLLSAADAHAIFESQIAAIERHWTSVSDEAELSEVDTKRLWGRQFLNPCSIVTV